MAQTTIKLKFLGQPDFVLDTMIAYPRTFIRHVFRAHDEILDVTSICDADALNRNAVITDLRNASRPGGPLLQVIVTPGDDDVDGSGFGNGPDPSDSTPETVVAGGGADAGAAATYARADHIHAIDAGAVGTTELAAAGVTLAKLAAAVQNLLCSVFVFGTGAAQASTTVYAAPGSGDGSSSVELQVPVPRAGVLRNLYVKCQTAPGVGHTDIVTVRKAGADTALTTTVAGTASTGNDVVHSVSVAAGDLISVKVVQGASSVGANYQIVIDYAVA